LGAGRAVLTRSRARLARCFAHGGGAFAFRLGRLENAWHEREVARGNSEHPPSAYLDRFCVDSAVFDERALRLLIDTFGAERVLLGTDYPFPLGEQRPGSLVRGSTSLSAAERSAVLGGNAAAFFGLDGGGRASPPPRSSAAGMPTAGARALSTMRRRSTAAPRRRGMMSTATTPAPADEAALGQVQQVRNHIGGAAVGALGGGTLPLVDQESIAWHGMAWHGIAQHRIA
jgi:aminocarboxymuconate-semialdehyde decarboxylase